MMRESLAIVLERKAVIKENKQKIPAFFFKKKNIIEIYPNKNIEKFF